MRKIVYQVLAQVFGIVLIIVGIGALSGGLYAHSYVTNQLSQEKITMPAGDAITALPQDSQKALKPFAGKPMTTGPQAQAYANHFIWEHMQSACANVKDAKGNALPPVPPEKCTYAGIGEVAGAASDPAAKTAYNTLRNTNFTGDSLRSMLLTAYAFWLVGSIAFWAAIACFVIGVVLIYLGFFYLKTEKTGAVRTEASIQ